MEEKVIVSEPPAPTDTVAIESKAPLGAKTLETTTELLAALEGPVPFALTPLTLYVYVPVATS